MENILYNDRLIQDYVDFRNKIRQHKFIFCYNGKITQSIVKNLLSMTERKIEILKEEETVKRKIFGVMINCLQTICAEEKNIEEKRGSIFMISKEKEGYSVYVGREFNKNEANYLSLIINELQDMSRESILQLHSERLKALKLDSTKINIDETILSIIDIARKTNKNLEYHIDQKDDKTSFFSIRIKIN